MLLPFSILLLGCQGLQPAGGGSVRHSETEKPGEGDSGGETGGTTDSGAAAPVVTVLSPADNATVDNPVTFEISASGVTSVALSADGWALGDAWDPNDSTTFSYTFTSTGQTRHIVLVGMDSSGAEVARDELDIFVNTAPSVTLLSPADGSTVENPVTFTIAAEGVATVALSADGWPVGDAWNPDDSSSFSYTFTGTGYARTVTLTGYDEAGSPLASDTITITIADGVDLAVPYYYQYDNNYEPSGTCGITSAAMVVSYLSSTVTPDSLYLSYGKSQGQSPSGLAQLYAWEGLYSDYTYTGTRDLIRAQLDAGRPVVVHGYFTTSGHIVVLRGYTSTGWIANDSAGDWEACYGCGVSGEAVEYAYGGGWDDLLGSDGDIWMSSAGNSGFSF